MTNTTLSAETLRRAVDYARSARNDDHLYYPVLLPPSLYDAAVAHGYDMRGYIKQHPIP